LFLERENAAVSSLEALIEQVVAGMGYEPVLTQISNRGKMLRIFIDRTDGVSVDDCVEVTRQLERTLAVEGVDYDRMEVSSPGMDRPLRGARDFVRFSGQRAEIRMRTPKDKGQRKFVGLLGSVDETSLTLLVEGKPLSLELHDIDRAKLVPEF
jgi:ribosome maturation factor RimP